MRDKPKSMITLLAGLAVLLASCEPTPTIPKEGRWEIDAEGSVVIDEPSPRSEYSEEYEAALEFSAAGKVAEAEKIYKALLVKEPDSADPHLGLGSCRLERHDYQGGLEHYRKAAALEPGRVAPLIGVASSHFELEDYLEAIKNYQAALTLDIESPEAHWGLSMAYSALAQPVKARQHFEKFKELAPDSRHLEALEANLRWALPLK